MYDQEELKCMKLKVCFRERRTSVCHMLKESITEKHLPKQVNSINHVLQLLHMDLFGLVNVLSINRNSCCLVMIDDFSYFTWVFFLSNKVGIAHMIKKFIVMIENRTNNQVKVLRSHNGTEFNNAIIDHFFTKKGIVHQCSSICTPQQNDVAERTNGTLQDATRTMLCDSKLPIFFWVEVINTACYVHNRVLINES